jgi:hypothetical protein
MYGEIVAINVGNVKLYKCKITKMQRTKQIVRLKMPFMTARVIKKRLKVKKKYKKSHENCLFGDKVVFLRAFWC